MVLDLASVVAVALLTSLVVCRLVIAVGPLDHPAESRKPHAAPTPTSGGVGIGAGFAAGMIALMLFSTAWRNEVSDEGVRLLWIASLFAYPLLVIGFIDDARHLESRLKFVLYAALSLAAAWAAGVVQTLPLGAETVRLPYVVGLVGTALWMFTLINAVNFMDGANGLSMGCVAIGLTALALIALERGSPAGAAIALCCVGALAGFLVWNFPNGRLFAGDSGALFAGAIAAFASLIAIARTGLSPLVPPILFFPLLADALLTLLFRSARGRPLLVGHAEHLYQLPIKAKASHGRVSLFYWALTALCGAAGLIAAREESGAAAFSTLAALALLAVAADMLVRRWAVARGLLQR